MEEDDGRGGFARLAAVVAAERAKGDVLFVHSGDTISPSLLSGIDKGAHIIDILNHMDVDLMVPGNHEFDFGPEVFQHPHLGSEIPDRLVQHLDARRRRGRPTRPTTGSSRSSGIKLGFYGLTTEDDADVSSPGPRHRLRSIRSRPAAMPRRICANAGRRFRRRRRPYRPRRRS